MDDEFGAVGTQYKDYQHVTNRHHYEYLDGAAPVITQSASAIATTVLQTATFASTRILKCGRMGYPASRVDDVAALPVAWCVIWGISRR